MAEVTREVFKPVVEDNLDIRFTGITEIKGLNKEEVTNNLIRAWVEQEEEAVVTKKLAVYTNKPETGEAEVQWAFRLLADKVRKGKA